MEKVLVGKITHYFDKIGVAVVEVEETLKEGDKIVIEGPESSFEQTASSMQIEKKPIKEAKKGDAIGMKVEQPVKKGFQVFKVTE